MQRTEAQGGRVSGKIAGDFDDDSLDGSGGQDNSDGSTQVSMNDETGGEHFIRDEEELSDLDEDEASSDNEF